MSKTMDKLNEAEFFLRQIEMNYLEYPTFDYFLGAFISSARSVLWIMRSEFIKVEGWETWYKSLKPSINDDVLFQKINAARIRTEKQAPIKTSFRIHLKIPKEQATEDFIRELQSFENKTTRVSLEPVREQNNFVDFIPKSNSIKFIGEIQNIYRVLCELGDEDVLVVCREYLATIKQVVLECETRFG